MTLRAVAPDGTAGTVTSVAVSGANGIGVSGSPITSAGTIALSLGAITPTSVNGHTLANSTQQVFLTGTAATYTTPAGVTQLVIWEKAGGGGGSGGGATAGNGVVGGATSFNSIACAAGNPGLAGGVAGSGGTSPLGAALYKEAGAPGGYGTQIFASATNVYGFGGCGGGKGGGIGGAAVAGAAGTANSGGGAGGGGVDSLSFINAAANLPGNAGGEGEEGWIVINSPAATYTYTVGAGGTAGAAGTNGYIGGVGGSGKIVVFEYY